MIETTFLPLSLPKRTIKKICFDFWIMFHQLGFAEDDTIERTKENNLKV